MKSPPTLYLIDGYAQFFRAYHAIRSPMSSPVTKEPTNMTFGFVGMLLKLLRGEGKISREGGRADYIVVALDVSGDTETFRSTLYPDYKANRPPPPEDLRPQVDRALSILNAIGVPVLGMEGFEADDVIATLVTQLQKERPDLRVRFISKDKDLKQLLRSGAARTIQSDDGAIGDGGRVSLAGDQSEGAAASWAPVEMYDIHTDELATVESLLADTGLTPPQVIDMLALMGDNVDNVPGVEGIGPKTAAQLIAQYGSLDGLLARSHEIKGKRGEALRATADRLPLSRTLVTLRHDVPVRLDLSAASRDSFKLDLLMPILRELGFNRYQDELKLILGNPGGPPVPAGFLRDESKTADAEKLGSAGDRSSSGGVPAAYPGGLPVQHRTASIPTPSKKTASRGAKREQSSLSGGLFDSVSDSGSAASDSAPVAAASTAPTSIAGCDYRCVTTKEQLDELIEQLKVAPVIAIDTETTHLSPLRCKLCGVSISIKPGTGFYIPVRSPAPDRHLDEATVLSALRPILEDPTRPKTGHNLKYDLLVFRRHGVTLRGLGQTENADGTVRSTSPSLEAPSAFPDPATRIPGPELDPDGPGGDRQVTQAPYTSFDSMVASFLIDASRSSHSLDSLALALLGRTNISIKELIGSGKDQRTFDMVPLEQATIYAAEDADVSLQLHDLMRPQLRAMGLMDLFVTVELPLVEVLAELEWNGIL
ncbi:MAG: hypothetical protein H7210_10990, partial [Pyrinomonadaceae bacterium]|nr:hypothetical protein [Phycisphaerales bacterium]